MNNFPIRENDDIRYAFFHSPEWGDGYPAIVVGLATDNKIYPGRSSWWRGIFWVSQPTDEPWWHGDLDGREISRERAYELAPELFECDLDSRTRRYRGDLVEEIVRGEFPTKRIYTPVSRAEIEERGDRAFETFSKIFELVTDVHKSLDPTQIPGRLAEEMCADLSADERFELGMLARGINEFRFLAKTPSFAVDLLITTVICKNIAVTTPEEEKIS